MARRGRAFRTYPGPTTLAHHLRLLVYSHSPHSVIKERVMQGRYRHKTKPRTCSFVPSLVYQARPSFTFQKSEGSGLIDYGQLYLMNVLTPMFSTTYIQGRNPISSQSNILVEKIFIVMCLFAPPLNHVFDVMN